MHAAFGRWSGILARPSSRCVRVCWHRRSSPYAFWAPIVTPPSNSEATCCRHGLTSRYTAYMTWMTICFVRLGLTLRSPQGSCCP